MRMTGKDNLMQECGNWVRVFNLIVYGSEELCLDMLFKKENWLTDGVHLYKKLEPEQSRICQFKNKRQVICPSSEIADHNDFDLILSTIIKYESSAKDMENLGHQGCHRGSKNLPNTDFHNLWKCTADVLQKSTFDLSLVDDLKDGDPFSDQWFHNIIIYI